jgi:hypothetical protein
MNARNILKALALAVAVTAYGGVGCTQRTIIDEEANTLEQPDGTNAAVTDESDETAIANHPLYVRSGTVMPGDQGDQQSSPHPQPWTERAASGESPHPQPWHRDGN